MARFQDAWLTHQQQRFMRPDASRYVRPGAIRWLPPGGGAPEQKYSEDQPRVPAGEPGAGQWTDADGQDRPGEDAPVNDNWLVLGDRLVLSDATPDLPVLGQQYAQVLVERFDKTGNSTVDRTTQTLMDALARAHAAVGEGSGPVYGIMVHSAFGADVKRENISGIGSAGIEQSFNLGDVARYGLDGSIRTDVVQRDQNGNIIAIWDVKTGGARLSGSRVKEIREAAGVGPGVPVLELHIGRGGTVKSNNGLWRAVITASLILDPDEWDRRLTHSMHDIRRRVWQF